MFAHAHYTNYGDYSAVRTNRGYAFCTLSLNLSLWCADTHEALGTHSGCDTGVISLVGTVVTYERWANLMTRNDCNATRCTGFHQDCKNQGFKKVLRFLRYFWYEDRTRKYARKSTRKTFHT